VAELLVEQTNTLKHVKLQIKLRQTMEELSRTKEELSRTKEELNATRQRLSDVQDRLTVAEQVTAATQQRALQESDISKQLELKVAELEKRASLAERRVKEVADQLQTESKDSSAFVKLQKQLGHTMELLSRTEEELNETRQRLSDVQERLIVAEQVTAATQQRVLQESDNSEQLELTPEHQPTGESRFS